MAPGQHNHGKQRGSNQSANHKPVYYRVAVRCPTRDPRAQGATDAAYFPDPSADSISRLVKTLASLSFMYFNETS